MTENTTVVSWNIMLDKTRTRQGLMKPQVERLPSQIETLRELGKSLDVVMIQEVEKTEQAHHGEIMARELGHKAGFWYNHNTSKRRGEYIGVFGARVENAKEIQLPHDKVGVLTRIGDVAFIGVHLRNENFGPKRAEQMQTVLEELAGSDRAVIFGDFNAVAPEKPIRLMRQAGFVPVFEQLPPEHELYGRSPKTFPTPDYLPVLVPQARFFEPKRPMVTYDNIYVRDDMQVRDAGVFTGDSDHRGVWADIQL